MMRHALLVLAAAPAMAQDPDGLGPTILRQAGERRRSTLVLAAPRSFELLRPSGRDGPAVARAIRHARIIGDTFDRSVDGNGAVAWLGLDGPDGSPPGLLARCPA